MKHSKIAIIGAGSVGSTAAYALLLKNIAAEIILIDIDEIRCQGEILDLSDALSFDGTSRIRAGTAQDAAKANIIIIAAGKAQNPDETRQKLFSANKAIISNIFTSIKPINPQAIIIMVTNPLDSLTSLAQSLSGLPRNQVFGTGTFLDTLRLRGIIAEKVHIAPSSINAYVIGEHGDSQCAAWSSAEIAGTPIAQFPGIEKMELATMAQQVKDKAYEIIACKGSTSFGIAACVAAICEAIIFDQKLVMPLSTYIEKYNTCLSMPAVVGENGIEKILPMPLNDDEQKQLTNSAQQLRDLLI
ncbi:MAG TPA: L-lactate dehydrogenase [Candidatus Babeliales bacterium]|jgi:L-lactate dehydrogenase|nr:L-lactate dehydrogenase [Candidatus Babeliales bacterium]